MPSNHLILCHPLLLPPSIFPSIRVFLNESALRIRCPKYRSFSFSFSPSKEYSGLISFRMDWLYLLAAQRTLRSLLQHFRLNEINEDFWLEGHLAPGFNLEMPEAICDDREINTEKKKNEERDCLPSSRHKSSQSAFWLAVEGSSKFCFVS